MNKNTIITKEFLQEKVACKPSLEWAIENGHLNNTLEMSIEILLEEKRYSDLRWLITRCLNNKQKIKLAIFAAESVLHIFESEFPGDDRPRKAIDAAKNKNVDVAIANAANDAAHAASKVATKNKNVDTYNAAANAAYASTAVVNAFYAFVNADNDAAIASVIASISAARAVINDNAAYDYDAPFHKKLAEYVLTSIMD